MSVSVRRHHVRDSEAARALRDTGHLSPTAPHEPAGRDPARALRFVSARATHLGVNCIDTTLDTHALIDLPDLFATAVVRHGTLTCETGGTDLRLGTGGAAAMPARPARATLAKVSVEVLYFPFAVLRRVAWELFDLPPGQLRLDTGACLPPVEAARWGQVLAHLRAELTRPASLLEHAFIEADYLQDAAAVALQLFANNAANFDYRRSISWAAPAVARRAADYIEQHAHLPVTTTDIAAGAGTSPTELGRAFAAHFGTTPVAYLELVRLHRVRDLLQEAPPGADVRAIAAGFGFRDHARFVARYRATFGARPGDTLRG